MRPSIFLAVLCFCIFLPYKVSAEKNTSAELVPMYIPPTSQGGWKVTFEDTRGAFSVKEILVQPGTRSNPLAHSQEHTGFYILEGEYEFDIGDRLISAPLGSFLFVPRDVQHTYKNTGTTIAKHLRYGISIPKDKLESATELDPVFIPPTSQGGNLTNVGKNRKGGWKVTAENTRGIFSIVETLIKPGMGPVPHRHSREDEGFYILEGQEEYRVSDRVILASAGSFVFAPRGVPHAYKNVGSTTSRHITIITPSGLKNFLDERNALRKELSATDSTYQRRLKTLIDKYGLEYNAEWSFPPVADE